MDQLPRRPRTPAAGPALVALGVLVALTLAGGALAQTAEPAPHGFLHNSRRAEPLFPCTAETTGQVACQAGVRCKCRHDAFGSAMLGRPPGHYWDCGVLHGSCLVDIPAETGGDWGRPGTGAVIQPPQVIVIPPVVLPHSGSGAAGVDAPQVVVPLARPADPVETAPEPAPPAAAEPPSRPWRTEPTRQRRDETPDAGRI